MAAPGDMFARRYRLVRVLGRGAMGVVHEAVHEPLGHRVAIKVLRQSDDDRAVRRFEREARLIAKLSSPNVIRVTDVDFTEDGVPYLVMELLDGCDLAREVEGRERTGLIAIDEAVSWVLAIADAMCAAHAAGVVHRDLKLSNIFLTNDARIKVLDFGVAAFRGSDAESSTTTNVAGTPRYMAPEQLLGEAPNPASDVWAAGVILYRLLTGRFPYDAPTMAAQMLAIMEGEKPIEDVTSRVVPKELAAIVHRALGRTLEERWPTMASLRDALRPFASTPSGERIDSDRRGDAWDASVIDAASRSASSPRDDSLDSSERSRPLAKPSRVPWRVLLALGVCILGAAVFSIARREKVDVDRRVLDRVATATVAPAVLPVPSASAPPSSPIASTPPILTEAASARLPRRAVPARQPRGPSASAAASAVAPAGDGFPNHL